MNNDLISRSALLEKILDVVETFSPVDAEPVRHGEWIYDPNANDFGIGGYICGVCSAKNNNLPYKAVINPQIFVGSRFCPNCGAKMDGGNEE